MRRANDPAYTSRRLTDGTVNDLAQPRMGGIGTRFGRNVPPPVAEKISRASSRTPPGKAPSSERVSGETDNFEPGELVVVIPDGSTTGDQAIVRWSRDGYSAVNWVDEDPDEFGGSVVDNRLLRRVARADG